jgi:hypothetical protein
VTPRAAETLSHEDAFRIMGISKWRFYDLKRRGLLDHLFTPEGRVSAKKLQIHLHGRAALEASHAR